MNDIKYSKIETLFNRNDQFKVIEGDFRLDEFGNIKQWYCTEKIHGDNTRVIYHPIFNRIGTIGAMAWIQEFKEMEVLFKGKNEKSEINPRLLEYLEQTFTLEKLSETFPIKEEETPPQPNIVLFGEGYGPKIQKGGNYRKDISFRLFDVWVADMEHPMGGWWLEPENIDDIAQKLGIKTVPVLPMMTIEEIVEYVKQRPFSFVSNFEDGNPDYIMEGVVARTKPSLFTRRGERLMFKLKDRDFEHEIRGRDTK